MTRNTEVQGWQILTIIYSRAISYNDNIHQDLKNATGMSTEDIQMIIQFYKNNVYKDAVKDYSHFMHYANEHNIGIVEFSESISDWVKNGLPADSAERLGSCWPLWEIATLIYNARTEFRSYSSLAYLLRRTECSTKSKSQRVNSTNKRIREENCPYSKEDIDAELATIDRVGLGDYIEVMLKTHNYSTSSFFGLKKLDGPPKRTAVEEEHVTSAELVEFEEAVEHNVLHVNSDGSSPRVNRELHFNGGARILSDGFFTDIGCDDFEDTIEDALKLKKQGAEVQIMTEVYFDLIVDDKTK